MRIAIISFSLPKKNKKRAGVDVAIHRLANALAESGADVSILSSYQKPVDALYEHVQIFPWLARLPDNKFINKFVRLALFPIMLNFLDISNFDVIHLNGDDWFYLFRRKPSIRVMHGSALREFQSAKSMKRKILQLMIFPLEIVSAILATITVGGGVDAARIYRASDIVSYGVDSRVFYPRTKFEKPTIFYVGTWQGRKRGKFIFDLFINDVLPVFSDATLIMACDFVPKHPNVLDLQYPSDIVLAENLGKSWIFAYPSVYEGFGIPYVEALASGTVIVTSKNPGSDYILTSNDCGIVCGDDIFGEELVCLMSDKARRELIQNKELDISRQYSWGAIAEHFLAIYKEATEKYQHG